MFKQFKHSNPKEAGFYVFRYEYYGGKNHELWVYASTPRHHNGTTYVYPVTMHNNRDTDTCCDFGQYVWTSSVGAFYDCYRYPASWRKMTNEEALEFSDKLYRFGRPSGFHKDGMKKLSMKEITEIQK